MSYNFQKFEATNSRHETRITVTKSNHVGFPTAFYKDNNVGDYKYAVLFYDPERKAVALRFTNDDSETGKFTIMRNSRDYGGGVVATSFFKANRIDTGKYAGRYEFEKLNMSDVGLEGDGSLFVFELREKQ
jgi:hypothetical protein